MSANGHEGRTKPAAGPPGPAWVAHTASAMGADHVRTGIPNQDSVATERFDVPGAGRVLVLAVADGHGHSRHFRSDRGSRMAVAAAVAAARQFAPDFAITPRPGREAATRLVSDVVARWRALVAADLAADPITAAQAETLYPDDPPEIPYGSTLLVAVVGQHATVLAQIGDGDMFLVLRDGRLETPVPSDTSLDGTQTTSMCQPDAVSAFRVALVSLAITPVFAVFAATDGYGNAQAHENWRLRWARDLVSLGDEHGTGWIGSQLPGWAAVCASSDGSGDDTTVALALNTSAALTAPPRREPRLPSAAEQRTLRMPTLPVPGGDLLPDPDRPPAPPGSGPPPGAGRPAGVGPTPADRTLLAGFGQPGSGLPLPGSGPPPGGAGGSGHADGHARRPALLSGARVWLAGAAVVIVAVVVYLLVSSSGPSPAMPKVTPSATQSAHLSPSPTPSGTSHPSPSPVHSSTGHSRTGRGSLSGKHHRKKHPSPTPSGQLTTSGPSPTATSTVGPGKQRR